MLNFAKRFILIVAIVLLPSIPTAFASTTFTITNTDQIPSTYDLGIAYLNLYFTASTNTTIAFPASDLQTNWFGYTPDGNGSTDLRWQAVSAAV